MNYTKIDTLSLSLPMSYFKKIFSKKNFELARFAFGKQVKKCWIAEQFAGNTTFQDFTDLNSDIYAAMMDSFLFDLLDRDCEVDPLMKRGKNFFDHSYFFEGGFVAWGGNNKFKNCMGETEYREERIQVYLDGSFCSKYMNRKRKKHIHKVLKKNEGRISRIDIALDFLDGEYTFEGAKQAYKDGEFLHKKSPKMPLARVIEELSDRGVGNTLYVGSRASGKIVRFYEKGKQLGDSTSPWLRAEVEFNTNNKREISIDSLLFTDRVFSSSYPYCKRMIDDVYLAAEECLLDYDFSFVKVVKAKKESIALKVMIKHAQNQYGKLFTYMSKTMNSDQVVSALSRYGIPCRLEMA